MAKCRPCSNVSAIERDASFVSAGFETEWVRKLWNEFVAESTAAGTSNPALRLRIARSANFFHVLEQRFSLAELVDVQSLATEFSGKFLRQYLLASRFVIGRFDVEVFEEKRGESTETRLTGDILLRNQDTPYAIVLSSFARHLAGSSLAPKTVRIYLRAAEAFCKSAKVRSHLPWKEDAMVRFLKRSPGHAASLGIFVRHCRVRLGWKVLMPQKARWRPTLPKIVGDLEELALVLKGLQRSPATSASTKSVAKMFSLAFGLPAKSLIRLRGEGRVRIDEAGSIEIADDAHVLPGEPLYAYAQRWLQLSRDRANGHF